MRYPGGRLFVATLLICTMVLSVFTKSAGADLIAEDNSFGLEAITFDTATGLRWLDVTLSTPYSHEEILLELQPGGRFEGFRLATQAEVMAFWQNAGINTGTVSQFTSENFQPIIDLMAFVGVTGIGAGRRADGSPFDYVVGHIDHSAPQGQDWATTAGLGADLSTEEGRPGFGWGCARQQCER